MLEPICGAYRGVRYDAGRAVVRTFTRMALPPGRRNHFCLLVLGVPQLVAQRCQRELGPSPAWRPDMSAVGYETRMCSGSTPTSLMPADQVAEVRIRCYRDVPECEVVVAVRGKEIILRCPDYDQAVKWARVECRSYGIASITAEHDQQSPRFFPAMW